MYSRGHLRGHFRRMFLVGSPTPSMPVHSRPSGILLFIVFFLSVLALGPTFSPCARRPQSNSPPRNTKKSSAIGDYIALSPHTRILSCLLTTTSNPFFLFMCLWHEISWLESESSFSPSWAVAAYSVQEPLQSRQGRFSLRSLLASPSNRQTSRTNKRQTRSCRGGSRSDVRSCSSRYTPASNALPIPGQSEFGVFAGTGAQRATNLSFPKGREPARRSSASASTHAARPFLMSSNGATHSSAPSLSSWGSISSGQHLSSHTAEIDRRRYEDFQNYLSQTGVQGQGTLSPSLRNSENPFASRSSRQAALRAYKQALNPGYSAPSLPIRSASITEVRESATSDLSLTGQGALTGNSPLMARYQRPVPDRAISSLSNEVIYDDWALQFERTAAARQTGVQLGNGQGFVGLGVGVEGRTTDVKTGWLNSMLTVRSNELTDAIGVGFVKGNYGVTVDHSMFERASSVEMAARSMGSSVLVDQLDRDYGVRLKIRDLEVAVRHDFDEFKKPDAAEIATAVSFKYKGLDVSVESDVGDAQYATTIGYRDTEFTALRDFDQKITQFQGNWGRGWHFVYESDFIDSSSSNIYTRAGLGVIGRAFASAGLGVGNDGIPQGSAEMETGDAAVAVNFLEETGDRQFIYSMTLGKFTYAWTSHIVPDNIEIPEISKGTIGNGVLANFFINNRALVPPGARKIPTEP
eukprot:GHVT01005048.1.p1 GENE.GHVT01005048.1~~GHVT01005048.1.p1  ORF type:complete len:694 (+),score=19.66 GHVT01005048.1:1476-3557(+)